jgi:acylpyruvate hydrolase
MRLASVTVDSIPYAARVQDGTYVLLPSDNVGALLAEPDWQTLAAGDGKRVDADRAALVTLVPQPNKIICLGLNYASHIAEMGRPTPEYPTLFAKYDGALIGPTDDVALPEISDKVDWEAELGVVIGARGRHVSTATALDLVAGYTVVNDVTVRDWQHRTREFLSGKTFEATTPVGPHLVTPDEVPPGAAGLKIRCEVDGEVMQQSNTDDLLFTVSDTIAYVSTIITLQPGDLIAMGTPGGVGAGRDPQVFLQDGQTLVTSIEGIGQLRNRCRREDAAR